MYRNVVLGALVWFSLGLLWFGLVGRHGLVYSPEESFAQGGGDD